ncbi:MAG: lipoate--protein ligase family protein [Thermoplasmata archaeon]|nr:MAG: lipoate--protein ligase family protein [Thermoplasmata archaeon]
MKLFNLGELNWRQTQLIYHALAYKNIESLVLHSSSDRYMCVGLHQNPRDELDIEYCNENNIGIFRREIGGGAVLLDNNQVFYHLIIHRNHPKVPYAPESFFRRFLQPVIQVYYELGISAEYRPLCDLVVREKKISGNGGGEIGECKVLGGSILLDFDYERMARAMYLTDGLKQRFLELMQNNLTTVQKELGVIPLKEEIYSILATKFADFLGPMTDGRIDVEITKKMMELDKQYSSDTWLYQRGTKQIWREIKVREGVLLLHKVFNTQKDSGWVTCEIEENRVKKVTFSNAFPLSHTDQQEIENRLVGMEYDGDKLLYRIIEMIKANGGVIVA